MAITAKRVVTVSRRWENPKIEAFVDSDEIGASMELEDFITSLAAAMGSPTAILTKAQLLAKMQQAASVVENEIKAATRYVV